MYFYVWRYYEHCVRGVKVHPMAFGVANFRDISKAFDVGKRVRRLFEGGTIIPLAQ